MKYAKSIACKLVGVTLSSFLATTAWSAKEDEPAIELVPVIVWRGFTPERFAVEAVQELRSSESGTLFVHAINPSMFLGGASGEQVAVQSFQRLLREGDGVAMHVAPIEAWLNHARLQMGLGGGLMGRGSESCVELCGIDRSLAALGGERLRQLVVSGREVMNQRGFGQVRIAVIEEGLIANDLWTQVKAAGINQDWSGFNLDILRQRMSAFPVFKNNELMQDYLRNSGSDGRSLEHIRYSIWAEGTDQQAIDTQMNVAVVDALKSLGTPVRIRMFVNAESLMHISSLYRASLTAIRQKAAARNVSVISWNGVDGSGWTPNQLRSISPPEALVSIPTSPTAPIQETPVAAVVAGSEKPTNSDSANVERSPASELSH